MKNVILGFVTTLVVLAAFAVAYVNFSAPTHSDHDVVAGGLRGIGNAPICICDDWNKRH